LTSNWRFWFLSHYTASVRRIYRTTSTRHGGGTSTSQVIGRLRVCRAADTVTDWRQKFHSSWTAAMEQSAGQTSTAELKLRTVQTTTEYVLLV